jgi:alkanesulfonate monooxygenase SsuD/methylene tetrahydromethanopterin reductase-like flavin-dependent oxidoreductase (luciferase family)
MDTRAPHPWVASRKGAIGFALQAVASRSAGDPGAALIRAGLHAERYGYDGFFLGDHPAWAPECWLHLAVVAAQTSHIRLGQLVAASPYRNPLLTARLQSDLDRLSGGRSILGLGIGWNAADYGLGENEFDRMGIPYLPVPARQAALEEAITIIRGVWGDEPFSMSGEQYSAANAQVDPRGSMAVCLSSSRAAAHARCTNSPVSATPATSALARPATPTRRPKQGTASPASKRSANSSDGHTTISCARTSHIGSSSPRTSKR